jgi:VIT1/CCC1 family predicted Fe2+/Mn2+ transporter
MNKRLSPGFIGAVSGASGALAEILVRTMFLNGHSSMILSFTIVFLVAAIVGCILSFFIEKK